MATKYFIHENNIQKGPFTKKQLKALNITKDTMVWGEGWPEWMPAGEAYDLKDIFKEVQSPAPQPMKVVNPRVAPTTTNFSALIKKWWLPVLLVLIAAGATVYFLLRKNSNVD
ncbi:MAG: DUF4339 domain-containing protein, partial [Bacteroidetes bacterium]|nr:DUF4339 domain-containing protein [Bacteroidota bacterium]